jgi:hypothetical protein
MENAFSGPDTILLYWLSLVDKGAVDCIQGTKLEVLELIFKTFKISKVL